MVPLLVLPAKTQLLCQTDLFTDDGAPVPQEARYVLQFMWRDEASQFDCLGPWFTHTTNFKGSELNRIFWKVMDLYASVNMQVHLVVCDAASVNVKFIKLNCFSAADIDSPNFNPSCRNPYTKNPMYFILDPSHMIKNFRNQLFASNIGRAKFFYARLSVGYAEQLRKKLLGLPESSSVSAASACSPEKLPDSDNSDDEMEQFFDPDSDDDMEEFFEEDKDAQSEPGAM